MATKLRAGMPRTPSYHSLREKRADSAAPKRANSDSLSDEKGSSLSVSDARLTAHAEARKDFLASNASTAEIIERVLRGRNANIAAVPHTRALSLVTTDEVLHAHMSYATTRGSFSRVALATTPKLGLAVLRTLFFEGEPTSPDGIRYKLSRADNFVAELDAMRAAQSPLSPDRLFSTGDGEIHFLQRRYECDLFTFVGYRRREPTAMREKLVKAMLVNRIAVDVFSRLAKLHGGGYVHHDVKPDNILVHRNGFELADYGLATRATEADSFGDAHRGTDQYYPPEILSKRKRMRNKATGDLVTQLTAAKDPYDGRAKDVFAAGLSLLTLITGQSDLKSLRWTHSNRSELLADQWHTWAALNNAEPKAGPVPTGAQLARTVLLDTDPDILDLLTGALHPTWHDRPSAAALARFAQANMDTPVRNLTARDVLQVQRQTDRAIAATIASVHASGTESLFTQGFGDLAAVHRPTPLPSSKRKLQ